MHLLMIFIKWYDWWWLLEQPAISCILILSFTFIEYHELLPKLPSEKRVAHMKCILTIKIACLVILSSGMYILWFYLSPYWIKWKKMYCTTWFFADTLFSWISRFDPKSAKIILPRNPWNPPFEVKKKPCSIKIPSITYSREDGNLYFRSVFIDIFLVSTHNRKSRFPFKANAH